MGLIGFGFEGRYDHRFPTTFTRFETFWVYGIFVWEAPKIKGDEAQGNWTHWCLRSMQNKKKGFEGFEDHTT